MLEEVRGHRKHTALHFERGHIFRFKFFGGVAVGFPRINFRPAGKHIERSEIIFRPGMNGEMRFSDHNDSGNTVRIKGVKNNVHDAGFRMFGGLDHDGFDFMNIV